MEMPMGGYFGSMHGGTGEDFISAVEVEAIKYPEYSIYVDDASNNPSEFVISSSRRDDVMGPHSPYLTSIHVEVQERDGLIYIDGQPFPSYENAAAQILADLEDERQYSIMSESIYGSGYYPKRIRNPMLTLSPEDRKKIEQLTGHEDEEMQRTGYTLATTLQQDEMVFPQDGEPYEELPYEGYDYLDDLKAEKLKDAKEKIQAYLPGFLKLPEDIIEAVIEFVFLSSDPTLHIQLDEEFLEEEIGEDMYERATVYPDRNLPENADAVKIVDSYRKNPKAHDPKFYNIYAAHSSYNGSDPFSRIDPYGAGDAQTGFHDGFREEYQNVTTKKAHNISSIAVEIDIIRMMRHLRPDHEEYVIN